MFPKKCRENRLVTKNRVFVQSNKLSTDMLAYTASKTITLEERFKSDFFVLFGIAAIGLMGCVYLLFLCNQPSSGYSSIDHLGSSSTSLQSSGNSLSSGIDYSGNCTIGSQLDFNIPKTTLQGQLLIDYGNGDNQIVSQEAVSYSYDRLGTYNVRLLQVTEDGLQTLANEYVEIAAQF